MADIEERVPQTVSDKPEDLARLVDIKFACPVCFEQREEKFEVTGDLRAEYHLRKCKTCGNLMVANRLGISPDRWTDFFKSEEYLTFYSHHYTHDGIVQVKRLVERLESCFSKDEFKEFCDLQETGGSDLVATLMAYRLSKLMPELFGRPDFPDGAPVSDKEPMKD